MSGTISAPTGFFLNSAVTPTSVTDLLSAVVEAEGLSTAIPGYASSAAASASSASSDAGAAATSAIEASSASGAAASSASGAAGSASSAATAATNAGTSATDAAGSATDAANSAASISSSVSDAATSATSAANSASAASTSAAAIAAINPLSLTTGSSQSIAGGVTLSASGTSLNVLNNGTVGGTLGVAGTLTGSQFSQATTAVLSGSVYPNGTIGFYQKNAYSGTVAVGWIDATGSPLPYNLLRVFDDVTYTHTPAGGKSALLIDYQVRSGQGNANGLAVDMVWRGAGTYTNDPVHGTFLNPFRTNINTGGYMNGATAHAGTGAVYGGASQVTVATFAGISTYIGEMVGWEFDIGIDALSTVNRTEGIKIVNQSGSGSPSADNWSAFISMSGNLGHLIQYGVTFGSAYGPVVPLGYTDSSGTNHSIGTAIYGYTGTLCRGIDFSAVTFADAASDASTPYSSGLPHAVIIGPNGFRVENSNLIHTNGLQIASSTTLSIKSSGGNPVASFVGASAVVSYPVLTAVTSGPVQLSVGGTATQLLLGTGSALTTTATTGHVLIPFVAGAPTGTPATVTGGVPLCYDTTNNKLWCYNNSSAAWKGVVLS